MYGDELIAIHRSPWFSPWTYVTAIRFGGPEGSVSRDDQFYSVLCTLQAYHDNLFWDPEAILVWQVVADVYKGLSRACLVFLDSCTSGISDIRNRSLSAKTKQKKPSFPWPWPWQVRGFARSLLDAGSQFTIRNGHSAPRAAAAGDSESFLHVHVMQCQTYLQPIPMYAPESRYARRRRRPYFFPSPDRGVICAIFRQNQFLTRFKKPFSPGHTAYHYPI